MNSNSKNTSSSSPHPRIIRSRTGATNAAGWLSASTHDQSSNQNNASSSAEPSDVVYLEVVEVDAAATSKGTPKLLKCQRKAAMMSTLLADMLAQDAILSGRTFADNASGAAGAPVLPLTNVHCSPAAIERVIAYCEYHCDDPPPGASSCSSLAGASTSSLIASSNMINNNSYRSFDETMDDDRGNAGGGAAAGGGGVSTGGDDHQVEESKLEIACYWDRSFIEAVVANGSSSSAVSTSNSNSSTSSSSSTPANALGLACPEKRAALYDLLIAAHYLGIERLVELGAKYICRQISGKSCEEVRALLNIRSDLLDPAEERRLHEENAVWASDLRASAETTSAASASALAKASKK